jgi:hypothetical protein
MEGAKSAGLYTKEEAWAPIYRVFAMIQEDINWG